MKKILILMTALMVAVSCDTTETQKQLNDACDRLRSEMRSLTTRRDYLQNQVNSLQQQVHDLNVQKSAAKTGREIKYIVKFKIKQGTFTLDPFEHIKNEANSIEIEIPVNKDYYNRLSIGQDITDSFKWGSLIIDGDFSTLHMKVVGKRIE